MWSGTSLDGSDTWKGSRGTGEGQLRDRTSRGTLRSAHLPFQPGPQCTD